MPGQTDTNGYLKISLASGGTISGDQTFTGNVTIQGNLNFGAGTASGFIFSTPQTVDSTMMFLDSTSRTLLITDNANKAKDHDHTGQTNPTLFIHSATDPDSANNQWISLSHDQTDGVISVGTGLVKTAANMQAPTLTCSSLTAGIILSGSVNNGVIYANTTTNQSVFGVGSNLGRQLILTDAANRSSDHDHDAQTNPTFYVHSATDPDTNNTQWVSLAHNKANAVIETGLGGIYNKQAGTVMADDGTITLPNATSGWGEVFVGDNEERARFSWTTAGVVTLMENTANVVNTDTDTKFCIYDSGTAVVIKNRLGSSKTVKYVINY